MTIRDAGSIATAVAVLIAAYQLWATRRQNRTRLEDDLNREYRGIVKKMPREALLDEPLGEERVENLSSKHFNALYRYIDLSNQQAFLRSEGRISRRRWFEWQEGIAANLGRPLLDKAWSDIKDGAEGSFTELQWVEERGYCTDPGGPRRRAARRLEILSRMGRNAAAK